MSTSTEMVDYPHSFYCCLAHYVGRVSLGLKDPKHATKFLAKIWRWNALELDGTLHLKNDMAETHYLMSEGLRMQGQHIASLVHLVQALILWNDHAEATEAATKLMRDHSAVGPEHTAPLYLHGLRWRDTQSNLSRMSPRRPLNPGDQPLLLGTYHQYSASQ